MTCTLSHACTGCYHGHHDQCRGEVRCPATWEVIPCDCCGERGGVA